MQTSNEAKTIVRGTSIVSFLTLISRILGFIRDLLFARLFGANFYAQAYFVAYRIPNLLRSFVAEGALTAAFVPIFSAEVKQSKEHAQQAISSTISFLLLVTTILTVLGLVFSPTIVGLFAPGFGSGTKVSILCINLNRIMFPYIICIAFIAMLNGALNTIGIFGTAAFSQVLMNIVLIFGAIISGWFSPTIGIIIMALSVTIGGFAQVIVQIPRLHKAGFRFSPSKKLFTPVTKNLVLLMAPATVGSAIYQLSMFLNTVFASLIAHGSIAWLFYADRLVQLPIGIFSVSLASVLLPTLSNTENEEIFSKNFFNALRYTSFIIIPISVLIAYFAAPIISLLFQRGEFDAQASYQSARAVVVLSLGLWGISCYSMTARAFIARKNTKIITVVGALDLLVSSNLAIFLMGPIRENQSGSFAALIYQLQDFLHVGDFSPNLGHVGLGLASSISSTIAFGILIFLLSRRIKLLHWKEFIHATLKSFISAVIMLLGLRLLELKSSSNLLNLGFGLLLGLFLYLTASKLFKMHELTEIIALSKKVLNKFSQKRRQNISTSNQQNN